MARAPLDDLLNLFHNLSCTRVNGIEHTASCGELCLCHWRMPCFRRPQHLFPILRKPILEDFDVDRVIKQFRAAMPCAGFAPMSWWTEMAKAYLEWRRRRDSNPRALP